MYHLDKSVIKWISSYLQNRTQFVMIGRAQSIMCRMGRGVPQGSVLGPLLYSIFTNEMAECVKNENCQNQSHLNNEMLFGNDCSECGTLTQYADDTTYHIGNKMRNENQTKLTENLRNLGHFF